ncbi:MAG: HIT family protein [Planctomycetes bacterium]|nr:HIT family protein [Planctomycetota bacterium]
MSEACVFCKMVAGQIPVTKVYEDKYILAFLDIGPVSEGHTLVIPKMHYSRLDRCPVRVVKRIAEVLPVIAGAVAQATKCKGYNLLCNNGRAAGQLVDHLHFHIIPRNEGDKILEGWPAGEYSEGQAEKIAEQIRRNL